MVRVEFTAGKFEWHSRQSCCTCGRSSIRGFAEPCAAWHVEHPSNRTGPCSKVNGPRLSPWQFRHPGSLAAERLRHRRSHAAVRIMAIDAAHRPLGNCVVERLLELCRHRQMAAFALFVDRFRFAHHQYVRSGRVNRMARSASHLISGMAALQSANLRRLIHVTGQANSIDRRGAQLSRVANIGGIGGPGVFRSRPVTGFAGLPVPSPLFVLPINQMMWSLGERLGNIFVTGAASLRSNIRRWRWPRRYRVSVLALPPLTARAPPRS